MVEKDRELLSRIATANQAMGLAVVELMEHQDAGELPSEGLRAIADQLDTLVSDLRGRANELDAVEMLQ